MINQKISIKNCNLADAKLLLNIHNSAVKKGYFTQTKIIRIKEQIKWVNFILKDGSTKIFIGLFNKKKFGYTRFKKINKYCFEVLGADTHSLQLLKGSEIQHSDLMFDDDSMHKKYNAEQYKKFDELINQLNHIREYNFKYKKRGYLHPPLCLSS